jgi:hypothetical protein
MRIRKSKDRQHNGQKNKDKWTNNDLQNITHKTKDRVTRTHPVLVNTGINSGAPAWLAVSTPLVAPVELLYLQTRCDNINSLG